MAIVDGTQGDDFLSGTQDGYVISGLDGNDRISSGPFAGRDTILGGEGDDVLILESDGFLNEPIIFDGGPGIDTIVVRGSTFTVELQRRGIIFGLTEFVSVENVQIAGPSFGLYHVVGSAGRNVISVVPFGVGPGGASLNATAGDGDDVVSGADGADTLSGEGGADELTGGRGADHILGGTGDDTLTGGPGDDSVTGGEGVDAVVFSAPRAFYGFAFQSDGSLLVTGPDGTDRLIGVEVLRFLDGAIGTPAPGLTLTGTASADAIGGASGDDLIAGLGGDDRLFGLAGQDTLQGGDGADLLNGADGGDNLSGGLGNDLLTGEAGADLLAGGDGNDTVFGGLDGDTLSGKAGDDLMNGNDGNDFLSGGAGADLLSGEGGADVLIGGDGDDVIVGGAFGDALTGGAGRDTFVFVPLGDSVPATPAPSFDFTRGEDRIDLTQVDANSAAAGDQAFVLVAGFTGVAGQATLIYEAGLNRTVFRGDVTGDGVADVLIIINGQIGAGDGILL